MCGSLTIVPHCIGCLQTSTRASIDGVRGELFLSKHVATLKISGTRSFQVETQLYGNVE